MREDPHRRHRRISRRHFLRTSAFVAGAGLVGCRPAPIPQVPSAIWRRTARTGPGEKLNIAIIGAGGKGLENARALQDENIIALCDVDEERAAVAYGEFSQAARYKDFRHLLDKERSLDAVVVSTPDHTHAIIAAWALERGLHVYCEKPLAHSVAEVRLLRQMARQAGVATQMGNQGHAYSGTRRMVELVRAGVVGQLTEGHVWTDRPIWPQGLRRPTEHFPTPSHLEWDLWLGPAAARPFNPAYHPFNWRGWWDFGTGALGDMACHNMDALVWAADLGLPQRVEAQSWGATPESPPQWSIVKYQFGDQGSSPPFQLTWYDGGKKPDPQLIDQASLPPNGTILIGTRGSIFVPDWHANEFRIIRGAGASEIQEAQPIPRTTSHYAEWVSACKGGPPALSNFEYAGRLTEIALLGNVAIRSEQPVVWNAARLKAVGNPEAASLIQREYRKGWDLPRLEGSGLPDS